VRTYISYHTHSLDSRQNTHSKTLQTPSTMAKRSDGCLPELGGTKKARLEGDPEESDEEVWYDPPEHLDTEPAQGGDQEPPANARGAVLDSSGTGQAKAWHGGTKEGHDGLPKSSVGTTVCQVCCEERAVSEFFDSNCLCKEISYCLHCLLRAEKTRPIRHENFPFDIEFPTKGEGVHCLHCREQIVKYKIRGSTYGWSVIAQGGWLCDMYYPTLSLYEKEREKLRRVYQPYVLHAKYLRDLKWKYEALRELSIHLEPSFPMNTNRIAWVDKYLSIVEDEMEACIDAAENLETIKFLQAKHEHDSPWEISFPDAVNDELGRKHTGLPDNFRLRPLLYEHEYDRKKFPNGRTTVELYDEEVNRKISLYTENLFRPMIIDLTQDDEDDDSTDNSNNANNNDTTANNDDDDDDDDSDSEIVIILTNRQTASSNTDNNDDDDDDDDDNDSDYDNDDDDSDSDVEIILTNRQTTSSNTDNNNNNNNNNNDDDDDDDDDDNDSDYDNDDGDSDSDVEIILTRRRTTLRSYRAGRR